MPVFMDPQVIKRKRVLAIHVDAERPYAGSKKSELAFEFILEYKREHDGNSPTIRQIMAGCGVSSSSVMSYYLSQLAGMGLIRRPEPEIGNRMAANIEVIGGKWEFTGGSHG